ncbi:hypothetical protein [Sutterella sp.]|uniref:hypothetical protein n=1 Tax=Sutterella sp. TaxID=1981025 RepID=UPI0026DFFCDE|nr:hypothetical protein [Sutterella sp.]MDO5531405.1 hypothetical protein [Sutterella sp.]
MEGFNWNPKVATMRFVYAHRRLLLPVSKMHRELVEFHQGVGIDEIPDEAVDEVIYDHGMRDCLIDADAGGRVKVPFCKGLEARRDAFCRAEILYRTTGVANPVEDIVQERFNKDYETRLELRRQGYAPARWTEWTEPPPAPMPSRPPQKPARKTHDEEDIL